MLMKKDQMRMRTTNKAFNHIMVSICRNIMLVQYSHIGPSISAEKSIYPPYQLSCVLGRVNNLKNFEFPCYQINFFIFIAFL